MHKNDPGYASWYKRKLKRLEKKRLSRKSVNPQFNKCTHIAGSSFKAPARKVEITVPTVFSLIRNLEETAEFFGRMLNLVCYTNSDLSVFVNMQSVKMITSDAIMYLLAIIMNTKHSKTCTVAFSGNVPRSNLCREKLEQFGFFNYVYRKGKPALQLPKESPHIIKTGTSVDTNIAKELCFHVNERTDYNRIKTKPLFSVIGELMTNSIQHAYMSGNEMISQWYICVEEEMNSLRFVFLDTGAGIPTTAKKTWIEFITKELIGRDEEIIKSAFLGKFRTRTKLQNRGKGLPSIYANCQLGIINDAVVISGQGVCTISAASDYSIETRHINNKLTGTLFTWTIMKGARSNNDNNKNSN